VHTGTPPNAERSGNSSDSHRRTLFRKSDNFSFFGSDPSERNLKFLAGNVITEGDIHSVAQHLTKELSMALYGLGPL
jgi:hypothetical protein